MGQLLLVGCLLFVFTATTLARDDRYQFEKWWFQSMVERAQKAVKNILDTTRNPRLMEEEEHRYEDKYMLAETLTSTAIMAEINVLQRLGLTNEEVLPNVIRWAQSENQSVTLRFQAQEECNFIETKEVMVSRAETEHEETVITEGGSIMSAGGRRTSKSSSTRISEKVLENHWRIAISYSLSVTKGNDWDNALSLLHGNTSAVVIMSGKPDDSANRIPPEPPRTVHTPIDLQITWLIQKLNMRPASAESIVTPSFSIDRFSKEAQTNCKTPRRNPDIEAGMLFHKHLLVWASKVESFFLVSIDRFARKHRPVQKESTHFSSSSVRSLLNEKVETVFHPILPLLEEGNALPQADWNAFLDESERSLGEVLDQVPQLMELNVNTTSIVGAGEMKLALLCLHAKTLARQYHSSIAYLEKLLEEQLLQAIGKEITPEDFDAFIRFHYPKILNKAPKPFSHAIRRPNHYPEGTLSIETPKSDKGNDEPIDTFARTISGRSLAIPINAATSVDVQGDRHLHGWIQYRWMAPNQGNEFKLIARAHQFSSFVLVIGTMTGADQLKPKHAIIIQNKDEVLIPLLTELVPSAKAFKDAIASLSPEQQAFARAFRSMQLESSVFGLCVIQLKPQLENLLGLPPGGLAKEIQLTQDLLSLFVDYQIPSDLLSFDDTTEPSDNANSTLRIASVKRNVQAVLEVIENAKNKVVEEEKRKKDMYEGGKPTSSPSGIADEMLTSSSQKVRTRAHRERRQDLLLENGSLDMVLMSSQNVQSFQEVPLPNGKKLFETTKDFQSTKSMPQTEAFSKHDKGDWTQIPKQLDVVFEEHDTDGYVRSTVLTAGQTWKRKRKDHLLAPIESVELDGEMIESETRMAFDLLDAISRSGTLPIGKDCADIYVLIAFSHCFEKDLLATVIEDNINPIEKVEKSILLLTSAIYDQSPSEVIMRNSNTFEKMSQSFPALFQEQN